jgi:predicted deacylase
MNRKQFWWGLAVTAALTGCSLQTGGTSSAEPPDVSQSAPLPDISQTAFEACGSDLPPVDSTEELSALTLQDFGCMLEEYETQYESYPLLEGDAWENTVYILRGTQEGATIYIVGGVHGDELAGWYAGILLRGATLKAGTIYLVAPANLYGAEQEKRKTKEERDLNRAFPGDLAGNDTQRIAAALYQDIVDKSPDLVLDLHEALLHTDGKDNLGNSVICQDITPISDLVFALLDASSQGELGSSPLDLYGSPPQGSLNRTLSVEETIPVITVETFREEALNLRVFNQLRLVEFVLQWYNMR